MDRTLALDARRPALVRARHVKGFTLVELVAVIIILGVLAAVALPKFIDLGRDARLASLASLAGTLRSTAEHARVICKTNPDCDYTSAFQQHFVIQGRAVDINYGWIDAGDSLNAYEIDAWIVYTGFTASLPASGGDRTIFTLDGAPDPANCSVSYFDAYFRPSHDIAIVSTTSGC